MCGHHFVDMLNKNPINATSRSDLMFYLCNLHNKVNIRLSKPEFNCTRDLYTTYGGDCGCGNDDNSEENTEKLKNPT